jgi:hypothetical protein
MSPSVTSSFLYYFFCLTAAFLVYNILGVYYNMKKHGLVGTNAVPHIDKWRKYLPIAKENCIDSFNKAVLTFALARAYVKRKWEGYKQV